MAKGMTKHESSALAHDLVLILIEVGNRPIRNPKSALCNLKIQDPSSDTFSSKHRASSPQKTSAPSRRGEYGRESWKPESGKSRNWARV